MTTRVSSISPTASTGAPPQHHILTVLVENKSGVLARVAGLFARRGFNIFSLAVAPTENPRFSRITIVVDAESAPIEQITKQLFKLIHVVKINELHSTDSVERELMMATVKAESGTRAEVLGLAEVFRGTVVDVGVVEMTLSVSDTPDRLDACEALLRPYGITEIQRTGRIALPRLSQ